jgi:YD repeat-containing protein
LGEALRDVCYDEASRIVGFTHLSADGTAQPALDQAFGWDENSRLTSITTATSSWSISCDPNGTERGSRERRAAGASSAPIT